MNATQPKWIIPSNEDDPNPPTGYVISFMHFHGRGFGTPASDFIRGFLYHYRMELQNLNPNSIL
jgi:hypothetical protein